MTMLQVQANIPYVHAEDGPFLYCPRTFCCRVFQGENQFIKEGTDPCNNHEVYEGDRVHAVAIGQKTHDY